MHRRISAFLIPHWIAAECELHSSYFDRAGLLYDRWRLYAHSVRGEPGSTAEFADEMERRGFACDRLTRGAKVRIRWGIRLREPVSGSC